MKFKHFQAPVLFSSTFKALNSGKKIQVPSRTFKDAWEPWISLHWTSATVSSTHTRCERWTWGAHLARTRRSVVVTWQWLNVTDVFIWWVFLIVSSLVIFTQLTWWTVSSIFTSHTISTSHQSPSYWRESFKTGCSLSWIAVIWCHGHSRRIASFIAQRLLWRKCTTTCCLLPTVGRWLLGVY